MLGLIFKKIFHRGKPKFWDSKFSIIALSLYPFSLLLALYFKLLRKFKTAKKISVPSVMVGNIVLGGGGKSPLVKELHKSAIAKGYKVAIVLRGYPAKIDKPIKVDVRRNTFQQVGDESLMHAMYCSMVWVCANQYLAACEAIINGANFIIFDDGMQESLVEVDLTVIAMPHSIALGNGFLFPAGALRESFLPALSRSQAVLWRKQTKNPMLTDRAIDVIKSKGIIEGTASFISVPSDIGRSHQKSHQKSHQNFKQVKWIFFCGIADARSLIKELRKDFNIADTEQFPDHHFFSDQELTLLGEKAIKAGAQLLTTAKDFMRLNDKWKKNVSVIGLQTDLKPVTFSNKIIEETIKRSKN